MADVRLVKPAVSTTQNIPCEAGSRFVFDFPTDAALFARDGDDLVLTFEDGSALRLQNFYTTFSKEEMPSFEMDGTEISGEDFFAALGDPSLMPAAGPAASAAAQRGGGFGDYGAASLLDGIDRLDGLDIAFTLGQGSEENLYASIGHSNTEGVNYGVTLTPTTPGIPDSNIPVIDHPDSSTDDDPQNNPASAARDVLTVHEAALSNGSGTNEGKAQAEGGMVISAPDGVSSIVIGGVTVFENGVLTGNSVALLVLNSQPIRQSVKADIRRKPLPVAWQKARQEEQLLPSLDGTVVLTILKDGLHPLIIQIGMTHQLLERGPINVEFPHSDRRVKREPFLNPLGQAFDFSHLTHRHVTAKAISIAADGLRVIAADAGNAPECVRVGRVEVNRRALREFRRIAVMHAVGAPGWTASMARSRILGTDSDVWAQASERLLRKAVESGEIVRRTPFSALTPVFQGIRSLPRKQSQTDKGCRISPVRIKNEGFGNPLTLDRIILTVLAAKPPVCGSLREAIQTLAGEFRPVMTSGAFGIKTFIDHDDYQDAQHQEDQHTPVLTRHVELPLPVHLT